MFSLRFRLFGRVERGGNFGEENQDIKKWGFGKILIGRELYTALLLSFGGRKTI